MNFILRLRACECWPDLESIDFSNPQFIFLYFFFLQAIWFIQLTKSNIFNVSSVLYGISFPFLINFFSLALLCFVMRVRKEACMCFISLEYNVLMIEIYYFPTFYFLESMVIYYSNTNFNHTFHILLDTPLITIWHVLLIVLNSKLYVLNITIHL